MWNKLIEQSRNEIEINLFVEARKTIERRCCTRIRTFNINDVKHVWPGEKNPFRFCRWLKNRFSKRDVIYWNGFSHFGTVRQVIISSLDLIFLWQTKAINFWNWFHFTFFYCSVCSNRHLLWLKIYAFFRTSLLIATRCGALQSKCHYTRERACVCVWARERKR